MLKIFGERVALAEVKEKLETDLAVPQTMNKSYDIGQVIAVGDGKAKFNGAPIKMEMVVKEGDYVVFQMNSLQASNCLHYYDGKPVFVLNQGDCIARLKGRTVKLEEFEVLGPWCLVEFYTEKLGSNLVLPDTADLSSSELQKHRLVQKGSLVKLDIDIGQEVLTERMTVNRLDIGGKTYGFVLADRICGVVERCSDCDCGLN